MSRPIWRSYGRIAATGPRGHGELVVHAAVSARGVVPRALVAWLPPGFPAKGVHYPVVYFQDGQNLFDDATSFAGSWKAQAVLDHLATAGRPAIGVAIPNAGVRRIHEYSPWADRRWGGGGGSRYVDFVADVVAPLVARSFPVSRDPRCHGLLGASMGGLIALWAFLRRSDRFGFAAAMSPSLFFGDGALERYVARHGAPAGTIYLDIGTLEGRRNRRGHKEPKSPSGAMRRLRALRRRLEERGFVRGETLLHVEEKGGRHDEAAWRRRLPAALDFVLPRPT